MVAPPPETNERALSLVASPVKVLLRAVMLSVPALALALIPSLSSPLKAPSSTSAVRVAVPNVSSRMPSSRTLLEKSVLSTVRLSVPLSLRT